MITRLSSAGEIKQYRRSLARMYISCFAEPPWNEVFTEAEVEKWFDEMLGYSKNIVLVFENGEGSIDGATFNFPVVFKGDILEFLPAGFSPDKVCYLAEMFVNPKKRRAGIAKQLHQERLRIAGAEGFRAAIHRTNFSSKMFPLVMNTGFRVIGRQEVASLKNIGGEILEAVDERAISFKRL